MADVDPTTLDSFIDRLDAVDESNPSIEVRSASRREIGMRIVPWDTPVVTRNGPEVVMRGAFDGVDPAKVVLRLEHENPPAGKGLSYENRDDGAWMIFRASKTQRGDDILTLAEDGVTNGVSVGYEEVPGGLQLYSRSGKTLRVVHKADLREVSTTWRPTWAEATVQFVRTPEETFVSDPTPTIEPVSPEPVDLSPITAQITAMSSSIGDRLAALEERARAQFTVPTAPDAPDPRSLRGDWMGAVLRMLSGERLADLQMRALADLVTSDNVGVVPDAYSTELIGVIDPSRPFLNTTRRLDLPAAGMSLVVPKIVTKPTAGVQAVYGDESYPEKSEITSTATSITNVSYDAHTIAGGGDISLQLLKRSSPSYLSLYLELLAEAYANNSEASALGIINALVGQADGVNDGGVCDPENLILGDAWAAGAAVRKPIDTMWMSSAAVGAFIDAKASGTNAPLYSSIQAGFTAGAGAAGTISGLRPVWVPVLDSVGIDVLVGPGSGFGWTEDGTYTLQVDVPAKAGRDVALVGILWFAPMYPTAFTAYSIAS
jgi:phage head maturation protease